MAMDELTVFKVRCPHCSKKHAIPPAFVGKVVLCQPCGGNFLVESNESSPKETAVLEGFDPRSTHLIDVDSIGGTMTRSLPPQDGDDALAEESEYETIDLDELERRPRE